MHLAIDLRFYKPEPYGLAVYISELFEHLVPALAANPNITKVTLILNKDLLNVDLNQYLQWWVTVENQKKFSVSYSDVKPYSFKEQLVFPWQLYILNPDLVYFFTFNFPFLYFKPFVYQVLDFSHAKISKRSGWSPKFKLKTLAALFLIKMGLKRAKKIIFLGTQTQKDGEIFLNLNLSNPHKEGFLPNNIVWLGVKKIFLTQKHADKLKSNWLSSQESNIVYSETEDKFAKKFLDENHITQEYFLSVSVWKKHKNLKGLIRGFEVFNRNKNFQLVICGSKDPNNLQDIEFLKTNTQFRQNKIIYIENPSDKELVWLQDKALGYVSPSFNEGMGLTLVEAAKRGTPVICSDILVFKDMFKEFGIYFNPDNQHSLAKALDRLIKLSQKEYEILSKQVNLISQKFSWEDLSNTIEKIIFED